MYNINKVGLKSPRFIVFSFISLSKFWNIKHDNAIFNNPNIFIQLKKIVLNYNNEEDQ